MNINRKDAIAAYEQVYSASDFEVIQARYRKKLLLELLEKVKPKRILEVGCGWESIVNHWAAFEQFTIVEPGPQFAAKARADVQEMHNVEVIENFLEEAQAHLAEKTFDMVLVSGLLHEVPDPEAILKQVQNVCHPNTVIHINVPNARSFHRLLALEMGLTTDLFTPSALQHALQQPRVFDLSSLKCLVEHLGFQVIESGSFFLKPFTHAQMMQLVTHGIMTEQMLDGLWSLTKYFPEAGSEIYLNLNYKEAA